MRPDDSHRLTILSAEEIDDLYSVPQFTEEDRQLFFDFSPPEIAALGTHKTSVAAYLALELGYFKAKQQFFTFEQNEVAADLRYILHRYFHGKNLAWIKSPSRPRRILSQQTILQLFNFRQCDKALRSELEQKARRVATLSTHPLFIMRELLQYLGSERIVVPSYTSMQDLVGRVVTYERNRITQLLNRALTPETETQIDALLQADEQIYTIQVLKREPKDFSYKELRQEVERRKFFQPLHEFAKAFLDTVGISNESSKYYASLVNFYTVYKLRRMAPGTTRLYLLCFAYDRFRQINDNLVDAFIHLVDHYEQQAKEAAAQAMQQALSDAAENLQAAGRVLNLFVDNTIPGTTPFSAVKEKAFSLLELGRFTAVTDYLQNIAFDKTGFEWSYYTALSHKFKLNLRQLFVGLDFAGRIEDAPLLDGVLFLQDLQRHNKSPRQADSTQFPVKLIPKHLQRYLFSGDKEKRLEVDRYEFLVYRLLRNALEAGDVYVRNSNEFRRFEDDLISDERWQDKETVLREVGMPILLAPIADTLTTFRDELERKIEIVNQRIADEENRHIKVKGKGEKRRWSLIYPNTDEPINSPFYGRIPGIGIADLLWFVAGKTGFLQAFTHVLDRYVKQEPDPREVLACIVAMGTNMGLGKMAEVSGLGFASLLSTARNFLRLETLREANDAISNAIATLPAFHLFDIQDEIHSSSDGQRLETQIDTFNARHSPKYFGLDKGVSACTVVANHVPLNTKVIGAHEHESHYVFDLLYNNTSDIRPDRHSTDTHGTNQVNFWILYAFGYQFAPRYRDLYKRIGSLVGFQHPSHYGDLLIKPARKVNGELIIQEWPNIQRIMASLAQKDVTQATIIRKLSSYARQNQTKKALWELDALCRTLYILDFVDDVTLRQSVQKALNRGEAYHRFRRAVAYVNGGKFRVKTEAEQQIWNECSRLIANAIIYYNTLLLSRVYEQKLATSDQEAIAIVKGISPIAWQHINLYGTFEFSTAPPKVDIDAVVAYYADPQRWSNAINELD